MVIFWLMMSQCLSVLLPPSQLSKLSLVHLGFDNICHILRVLLFLSIRSAHSTHISLKGMSRVCVRYV